MHTSRRNRFLQFAIATAMMVPSLVAAQVVDRELTLEQAIAIAHESNPGYLQQRNQLRTAEWGVRAAYGNLLPTLSSSTGFGYTAAGAPRYESVAFDRQPAQLTSQYNLGLNLTLDGSTILAPGVARAERRAAEQTVDGAAATLDANVTQSYLAVLEAQATIEQAERELERTAEHVRLAQARLDVGAGISLDVRRAEVEMGQAEVQLLQAQTTAANNLLLLGQTIGMMLPDDVVLAESFELFEPTFAADELISIAVAENPTLQANRAQASAAATRARAATSTYLPSISFSAGFSGYISQAGSIDPIVAQQLRSVEGQYQGCLTQNEVFSRVGMAAGDCGINPASPGFEESLKANIDAENSGFPFGYIRQPARASVSLSLPIFTGLTRQHEVEQARVARLNAEHQVQSQQLQIQAEVESALRNLETAYRSALLQQRDRETAEEELRLAEERFRFGATTSVEVVDAQAGLAETERAEIAALYEFHRSLAILEAGLGQPLER
ncbi:MAG: hypothetical protein GEU90_09350 [Gemmatimonas sp.]|nr:hypothetical protein [Gemmatimonas sp.]